MATVTRDHPWLNKDPDKLAVYNAKDCLATLRAYRALLTELADNGQLDYYQRWFSELSPVALKMWHRGFGRVDKGALAKYRRSLTGQLRELEGKLMGGVDRFTRLEAEAATAREAALASHPQRTKSIEKKYQSTLRKLAERRDKFWNNTKDLRDWLFDDLGLVPAPAAPRLKRTARSVSQEALTYVLDHLRVRDEPYRWVLQDLFHRSRLHTIQTRYLNIEPEIDGRIRPTIKLHGARTGRWAYADPPLQQWPAEIRHVVVPAPGCVFVSADHKQLEARIMAVLSGDQPMLDAFARGDDVHTMNALDFFAHTEDTWAALTDEQRYMQRAWAKKTLYATSYGGGAFTMKTDLFCPCPRPECVAEAPSQLNLSRNEVAAAQQRWEGQHPAVLRWRTKLLQQVVLDGNSYISPWGWRRFLFEPVRQAATKIYNLPMQHGASRIVDRSMVALDQLGAPLVLQRHDEIVLECLARDSDRWSTTLREVMERPVPELGGHVFPVDVYIGENWGAI